MGYDEFSEELVDIIGLNDEFGTITGFNDSYASLSEMNDSGDYSFRKIATIIIKRADDIFIPGVAKIIKKHFKK